MAKKKDFKRVMLKISGEYLGGEEGSSFDFPTIDRVCKEIELVIRDGKQVAVVMGAGNFFRGRKGVEEKMDRVASDQIGMIGTVMNALMLRERLIRAGVYAVAFSAFDMHVLAKKYSPNEGRELMECGAVTLCGGGTGNPFFTTDTAAVLRALELGCEIVLKATMVDGVYDKDPLEFKDAVRFDKISHKEVLDRRLKVMDLTAVALAESENLPIAVFNLSSVGMLKRVAGGDFSKPPLSKVEKRGFLDVKQRIKYNLSTLRQ